MAFRRQDNANVVLDRRFPAMRVSHLQRSLADKKVLEKQYSAASP